MKTAICSLAALVVSAACFTPSFAGTPVLDGTLDVGAGYGSVLAVQNTDTSFGNADGSFLNGDGELDNLYATSDATHLYLFIGGNIASNGNIYAIYIDNSAETGGVNVTPGLTGGDGYFEGNKLGGITFPAGMNVDYALAWKCFDDGGDGDLDWRYQTATYVGTPATGAAAGNFDTGDNSNPVSDLSQPIKFGRDNSNNAGVNGYSGPTPTTGNPGAVTTGLELAIPRSEFGSPADGTAINIVVAYTGASGDFWSNQTLPSVVTPQDHLGNPPLDLATGSKAISGFATHTLGAVSSVEQWSIYE